mmetsp:Transcript_11957/g.33013  ORF Transcript_11957/g.33013 Transcript_11957/m.33013 type:complete len:205 (+) Transcript_11957:567-1181(+)
MAVIGITENTDCPKSDCVLESASHAPRNRVIHSSDVSLSGARSSNLNTSLATEPCVGRNWKCLSDVSDGITAYPLRSDAAACRIRPPSRSSLYTCKLCPRRLRWTVCHMVSHQRRPRLSRSPSNARSTSDSAWVLHASESISRSVSRTFSWKSLLSNAEATRSDGRSAFPPRSLDISAWLGRFSTTRVCSTWLGRFSRTRAFST